MPPAKAHVPNIPNMLFLTLSGYQDPRHLIQLGQHCACADPLIKSRKKNIQKLLQLPKEAIDKADKRRQVPKVLRGPNLSPRGPSNICITA